MGQSRRRTILYVGHTATPGGAEIALLNLLRHLDRGRFHPVVLLGADGPLVGELRRAGVETHVLPLATDVVQTRKDTLTAGALLRFGTLLGALASVGRLTAFLRARRVDLVHTNTLKADLLAGLAARLAGRRVLWHVRDRIADDYIPRPAATAFRVACCLLADYVAANSEATLALVRPAYARVFGRAAVRERLCVIHDGVVDEAFVAEDVGAARAADPFPADGAAPGSLVGLVGRISPFKGQDVFVRAAAKVRERFPRARFRIIGAALFGEQAYERRVRGLVDSLGLRDAVEFTGFRSDVARLIAGLDVLVHASVTGEPFGQVIVEGMAAGKPVVATDGGGVPEIVLDGVTGLLVPMNQPAPMAEAIEKLLADPQAAARMGRLGRERAREFFSIRNTARKVEAFYERIFTRREGGGG
jgi:glycosyltransferase involved in cell wall biosynthesis